MWYGLVNPETGDLASVGTESMFEGGIVPGLGEQYQGYNVIVFGETAPNWSMLTWDVPTQSVVPRPAPVIISRLDDIEQWLLADPDFILMWNALNQTRKTQLRNGWRRVMARLLGQQQWRGESEDVEL